MYRSVFQTSICVCCNSPKNLFPCVARNYCSVAKSRKKRASKVDVNNVSKLSSPDTVSEKIKYDENDPNQNISSVCGDLMETELLDVKPISSKKKKKETASKDDGNKMAKEKKSTKSNLCKTDFDKNVKLSLAERYGDSLNTLGMKPFSIVKQKKVLPEAQSSDKKSESDLKTTCNEVNTVHPFQDPINISEVVPKLRSTPFRLEQKLTVPSEWFDMADWTPSVEFLKRILEFPIDSLEKTTSICEESTEYVSCFTTENKSAAKVVPAVTTVLSKTMTPAQAYALKLWRERLTKQLGEEGFQKHKTEILTRGKQFHDTIQRYLQGEPVQSLNIENLPLITGCWKSLVPVLNRIDGVIAVESEVLHPNLLYRGVIDCIVEVKGQPFIVEWKHSSRKRESLQKNYDSPVQLMAYTGAINSNTNYPFGVKNSLLVVAYDDGSPADVFLLSAPINGEHHWNTWLKRLHTYWTLMKAERELGK